MGDSEQTFKVCVKCQASKPLSDFYKKGSRWDAWCRPCRLASKKTAYHIGRGSQSFIPQDPQQQVQPSSFRHDDSLSGNPVLCRAETKVPHSVSLDPSKECSGCGVAKALTEFYSKGLRLDATCKPCVKARKQKGRNLKVVGEQAQRFQQIIAMVEDWELAGLKELTAKLKELNDRCESRSKNPL